VNADQEPDAEAEVGAEVDEIEVGWPTAVHQLVLDMEAGFRAAEAEAEAARVAEQAALEAAGGPQFETWEEYCEHERQAYLEEKSEAEFFANLEAEIGEPEVG
jgi:hypothetical protein